MLDFIRTAAAGFGELLLAADLWPVLVLAGAFGLLLLQLTVLTVVVSSQSRRLSHVSRHLRELSKVVQRQAQAIEQLHHSNDDLAPAPRASALADGAEEQIPDMRELADSPADFEEQFKALQEIMLAETSKKD